MIMKSFLFFANQKDSSLYSSSILTLSSLYYRHSSLDQELSNSGCTNIIAWEGQEGDD